MTATISRRIPILTTWEVPGFKVEKVLGTVWGIMNAVIGISKSQTTNLAVVAPGIAEALLATALGSIPNTAAYVVAGARASTPTSPVFLIAMGFIVVTGCAGAVVAWCKRHHLGKRKSD